MRRIEEKKLIIINIILLIVITLFSIFIQLSQNSINEYNHKITKLQNESLNLSNLYITSYLKQTNAELNFGNKPAFPEKINGDKIYVQIIKDYKNNLITVEEFWQKMINYFHTKAELYRNEDDKKTSKINEKLETEPNFIGINYTKIINWLYVVQIGCIASIFIVYLFLIKNISNRINKR